MGTFAEDFGYDLDEEGHPLEASENDGAKPTAGSEEDSSREEASQDEQDAGAEKEEAPVPA